MLPFLFAFSKIINSINEWIGRKVAWLTTVLVVLVCIDVAVRYIFSDTAAWIMELEWHLFSLIFLLGAAYSLKHDRHVRVDLFYTKFSKENKTLTNLVGTLVFLIPWCLFILYYSFQYGLESLHLREGSPDPGGLPARYLIKFAVPAGIFLLLLQGLATVADSILLLVELRKEQSPPTGDDRS